MSLYGLKIPVNAGGFFCTALQGLNTVSEYREVLERLEKAQVSVQELKVEVKRLSKENKVAASSRDIFTRPEGSSLLLGRRMSEI